MHAHKIKLCAHTFRDTTEKIIGKDTMVDKHAPLRTMRVRARSSPWITSELKKRMHNRNILKIKTIRSKDPFEWMQFKKQRNI